MLGISVYFKDLDYEYLEKCAQLGAQYVFTSLHIPEEDYSNVDIELPKLIQKCNQFSLQIVPDISPITFEKLRISHNDFDKLKELGITALRLDYGFDDIESILRLSKEFKLFINASIASKEFLEECEDNDVELNRFVFMHNFYPKAHTGLTEKTFEEKNALLKKWGLTTQAFVCGDDLKRFPLYEGLPTLEKHRIIHPYVAAVELIQKYGIDDVFIGDSKAQYETIKLIQDYMDNKTLVIKAHLEKDYEYLYEKVIPIRQDGPDYSIRLGVPRKEKMRMFNNTLRRKGSITMDNKLMGRYSGEVHIHLEELAMDARVNVIGFIHPDFVNILEYRDAKTCIKFIPF